MCVNTELWTAGKWIVIGSYWHCTQHTIAHPSHSSSLCKKFPKYLLSSHHNRRCIIRTVRESGICVNSLLIISSPGLYSYEGRSWLAGFCCMGLASIGPEDYLSHNPTENPFFLLRFSMGLTLDTLLYQQQSPVMGKQEKKIFFCC